MKNKNTTPEVVVVTGASAGVGRATAVAFGKRGAYVGLLARGHAGLEAASREVEAAGGKALAIPTDVSDPDQVEAAAQKVEEAFGPIDVWVNDAKASYTSKQLWVDMHAGALALAGLGLAGVATVAALARRLR